MNVPSGEVVALSLPSRARPTSAARSAAISWIVFRSASRITGTTSPFGAATAIPTCAAGKRRILSPVKCAFTAGWRSSAAAADLRQQVADGRLRLALAQARDEPLAQLERAGHVDRDASAGRPAPARLRSGGARSSCGSTSARSPRPRRPAPRRPLPGPPCGAATAPRSTSSATIRPSGPLPRERRDVDPLLAREPARERRGLDPAVRARGRVGDGGGRRLGGRGGGLLAARALVVHARRGGAFGLGLVLLLDRRLVRLRLGRAGAPPFPEGTSSPSLPMKAIVLPTSTSPESTTIFSRTPSASASTSCVTLSVSSS